MNPFKKIDDSTYQDSDGTLYKPIPLYEDYYVSNLGNIYSTKWGKWKKLKIHLNENGYRRVTLRQNGKTVVRRVAKLTALAFISAHSSQVNVLHRDGNKLNDHVNNLKLANQAIS
tara:strand:- start:9329 stop:9673 length:345 start_codon:yes stop_codon:yes gene_type:complete